jgi:hypothetical protein
MRRTLLAIFARLLVGVTVAWLVELPGTLMYPLPPDMNPFDKEAMKEYMAALPTLVQASGVIAWTAGAFTGAWLSLLIARRAFLAHGLIIGVLFLAPAVVMIVSFPHPGWLAIIAVIAPPVAGCFGAILAARTAASERGG